MKYLILLIVLCFIGCNENQRSMISSPDLGGIAGKVTEARKEIKAKQYDKADAKLVEAEKIILDKQTEVNKATDQANKMAERLNYLEPKYNAAVGIVWKWRLIAGISWLLLVGWFVARQYFPFLKIL